MGPSPCPLFHVNITFPSYKRILTQPIIPFFHLPSFIQENLDPAYTVVPCRFDLPLFVQCTRGSWPSREVHSSASLPPRKWPLTTHYFSLSLSSKKVFLTLYISLSLFKSQVLYPSLPSVSLSLNKELLILHSFSLSSNKGFLTLHFPRSLFKEGVLDSTFISVLQSSLFKQGNLKFHTYISHLQVWGSRPCLRVDNDNHFALFFAKILLQTIFVFREKMIRLLR